MVVDVLTWITLFSCVLFDVISSQLAIPRDYCSGDAFSPSCSEGSVIVMKSATYGLMEVGDCLTGDFGHLGCQSNQLAFFDRHCSGQTQCQIDVSSRDLKDSPSNNCPKDFATYLEAAYKCQKVFKPPIPQCTETLPLVVKGPPVYLASTVAMATSCGLAEAPILLQAEPGQKINLTLVDFSWSSAAVRDECPVLYGHVASVGNDDIISICGGSAREKHVHLSSVNQVQIMINSEMVQEHRFLIKYEVIGCPDLTIPRNAWLKKDNGRATIGCHDNSHTWEMKCVGKLWIGMMENCSVAAPKEVTEEEKTGFNSDHVISVAIGSLALVLCCITVTIGVYCIKRHQYHTSFDGGSNYMVPVYRGPANTIYTKYRPAQEAQEGQQTVQAPGVSHLTDLNNSVATGYSFQRPPGNTTLAAVQVHQPPLQAVQVHQRPLVATHIRQPSTGSEARRILATQAAANSNRSRTMLPGGTSSQNPPAAVRSTNRTLPPPLPQRPLQQQSSSNQSGALLQQPLRGGNASKPSDCQVASPTLPPPPVDPDESSTLLSNNRPRGVHSPDAEQEDDDSVKYYVLEGPSSPIYRTLEGPLYKPLDLPLPPPPIIKPTLNSDPENSE